MQERNEEREKGIPKVEELFGIGPERAEKLKERGIADIEDFYGIDEIELGKILGISESHIRQIKENNASLFEEARRNRERQ